MFQQFGIDRLKKLVSAGIFAEDETKPGSMAVRRVIDTTHIITALNSNLNLAVGTTNHDVYTVPANFVFELNNSVEYWSGGGTVTQTFFEIITGGQTYVIAAKNATTVVDTFGYNGSIYMPSGSIVRWVVTVSVAGVNINFYAFGVLHPLP